MAFSHSVHKNTYPYVDHPKSDSRPSRRIGGFETIKAEGVGRSSAYSSDSLGEGGYAAWPSVLSTRGAGRFAPPSAFALKALGRGRVLLGGEKEVEGGAGGIHRDVLQLCSRAEDRGG